MPETSSRISASSSTIKMSDAMAYPLFPARGRRLGRVRSLLAVRLRFVPFRFRLVRSERNRNRHSYPGAVCVAFVLRCVVELKHAAMLFCDPLHNGKAEPCSFLPGCDIGLNKPVPVFLRQPTAIIDHAD